MLTHDKQKRKTNSTTPLSCMRTLNNRIDSDDLLPQAEALDHESAATVVVNNGMHPAGACNRRHRSVFYDVVELSMRPDDCG